MQNIPREIILLNKEKLRKTLSEELMESRSFRLFENAIKSPYTRKNYHSTLRKFMEFAKMDNFDHLIDLPEKKTQLEQ